LRQCVGHHSGGVPRLALSPDAKLLASAGKDCTIRIWDVATGKQVAPEAGHLGAITSLRCRPTASSPRPVAAMASCALGRGDGEEVSRLVGHTGIVWSVAFSINGKRLVSGSADRTARLWGLTAGQMVRDFQGHGRRCALHRAVCRRQVAGDTRRLRRDDRQHEREADAHLGRGVGQDAGAVRGVGRRRFCPRR
jgi:WD40 repeat protein